MSKEDPFLQFPLCVLAYGDDIERRMHALISYSFVEAGREMMHKLDRGLPEMERIEKRVERVNQCSHPEDCNPDLWPHCAAVLGAQQLGILMGAVVASVREFESVAQHVAIYAGNHKQDPIVRVPKSLCFEVRDGGGMDYREFSVLCAVNSIIGAKKYPVAVRRDLVKVRALGYKNRTVAKIHLRFRKDKLKELSDWQVRSTLEKLHMLGWFARAHDGHERRTTSYSNKLNDLQLREAILESQTYREAFRDKQRKLDSQLAEMLKRKRAEIHRKTTTIIADQPELPPTVSPPLATGSRPQGHHGTTTKATT